MEIKVPYSMKNVSIELRSWDAVDLDQGIVTIKRVCLEIE